MVNLGATQAPTDGPELEKTIYKATVRASRDLDINDSTLATILRVEKSTITGWNAKQRVSLVSGRREILSSYLSIYRSLATIFSKRDNRIEWLNTEHPDLGDAPLSMMKASLESLFTVRRYLDFVRGKGA